MWVDFNTGKAKGCDEEFYLTSKEVLVMNLLIVNRGKVVSREELLEKVWGYSPNTETRTVDNFISRLIRVAKESWGLLSSGCAF